MSSAPRPHYHHKIHREIMVRVFPGSSAGFWPDWLDIPPYEEMHDIDGLRGVLFLGLVADTDETHAVWYGMLNMLGTFNLSVLTGAERSNNNDKRHYFWFGEVGRAAMMAGVFAVPLGIFQAAGLVSR